MKIALQVKNLSKAVKPSPDNVILFDGKEWYITTKAELFKEYDERFAEKIKECDEMIQENKEFKLTVAKQLADMSDVITRLCIPNK